KVLRPAGEGGAATARAGRAPLCGEEGPDRSGRHHRQSRARDRPLGGGERRGSDHPRLAQGRSRPARSGVGHDELQGRNPLPLPGPARQVSREHIYLVPGFFGFTNLGELSYFGHLRDAVSAACTARGLDVVVHAIRTPPTASLRTRAARLAEAIAASERPGDGTIHLIGHSSGGLDVRLLLHPGVALPTATDVERIARRVRTAVTVSTPHYGTPVASFFTSLLGQRLLQLLSLLTIYVLRFGHFPVAALLRLGAVFARLDRHLLV